MEIQFTAATKERLHELASRTGKHPTELVEEAVDRYLEEAARFRAAVREGFAAIDAGNFIDEDEMDARVQSGFRNIPSITK